MNNYLTATRMSNLLTCARRHYWRFEVGLIHETESLALRFGKSWALAMKARAQGLKFDDALAAAMPPGTQFEEIELATFSGLLAGYYVRYLMDDLFKTIYPEVPFSQPLEQSRTFTVAGRIDGLCQLHDERLALKEDKTTSDSLAPDSDYWLRNRFNSQLFQYVLAAQKLGWDIEVVIYDVTRKPAIEPRQVPQLDAQGQKVVLDAEGKRVFKKDGSPRESGDKEKGYVLQATTETPEQFSKRLYEDTQARPEFYFARREVPILEDDLDAFCHQRLALSWQILQNRQSEKRARRPENAWPRHVSEWTCRTCQYSSFCLQNLSVDLAHPPAGFKIGDPNPELAPENAQPQNGH